MSPHSQLLLIIKMTNSPIIASAKKVIETEATAISSLINHINQTFEQVCQLILNSNGRVIIMGMGKSGHIGCKIAATLASTGTPSFFIHPSEASHGDMGMITSHDIVIIISYSGETPEVLTLIPFVKRISAPIISMTGNPESSLARASNYHLNIGVKSEACPLGLAPTSSTTATLVMGDALAVALLETRKFTRNDFALYHPAGSLGRKLLLSTKDLMHTGTKIPKVKLGSSLHDTLYEMTTKKLGMTTIVDEHDTLQGIYTDGDLRRTLDNNVSISTIIIDNVMTTSSLNIHQDTWRLMLLSLCKTTK
jgi:arabinose-5-phosphate isomerase